MGTANVPGPSKSALIAALRLLLHPGRRNRKATIDDNICLLRRSFVLYCGADAVVVITAAIEDEGAPQYLAQFHWSDVERNMNFRNKIRN